jgi:serine/threonine protein kinase
MGQACRSARWLRSMASSYRLLQGHRVRHRELFEGGTQPIFGILWVQSRVGRVMDTLLVVYVLVPATALVVVVSVALIVRARRRRRRCGDCGTTLPRGSVYCPRCGSGPGREEDGRALQETAGLPAGSFELMGTKGPLSSRRTSISPRGLTIGRHPDNDVTLSAELMVSRHHAVVALEQGRYVLYDRESVNGTWVNGQRIFRHKLASGDRIQVGHSEFVFVTAGGAVPSPVPTVAPCAALHVEGQQFAGYVLDGLIGRGGMSEVFKARNRDGQIVAIKILQQTDPYLITKFVQEGNEIGPLLRDHPNIVYIHEFGQSSDRRLYIVMEFVDAPSLRQVLRRPLAEPEIVKIMRQACSALGFAHQHNIVHRDIKPENMLVTTDGTVKVLDFGIAKLTSAATVTRDKIIGTPEYLSPEQARGEPVQPASDVYSLGIVLYELLVGRVPFPRLRGEDPYRAAMEVIRQHLEDRPKSIRKERRGAPVSARLERVAMKALEKDARKRYASALDMGKALGEEGEPTVVPGRPVVRPARASLLVVEGARQGYRFPLTDNLLTLGRFELGSTNTAISRRHASIGYRGGGYWLQDTSKNGTLVDNQRVYGEVPLKSGTIITIGDNVLRLDVG